MVSFKSAILAATFGVLSVAAVDINVSSKGGNATGGHWYGFLHEDINNSGDGGIYAELIRNRAFQFSDRYPVNLNGWYSINGAQLSLQKLSKPLSSALPYSVNVAKAKDAKPGPIGIFNDGYWGMDVKRQKYTGSFWVRGAYKGVFTASLQSNLTKDVFGSVKIASKAKANEWVEHAIELVPNKNAPNSNNTFAITFDPAGAKDGSLDFNLISLFPPTYKNRKNGLRRDIAEALAELHPTTLRFPGGNMLEGNDNRTFWDWKDTLGPLRNRPGFPGTWGYQQTHGLGLLEYLEWTEDMGLEPIVAVWAGLALNGDITPKDKLQPFIDDALDQIEFIRGPASSKWGRRRAELGHPKPFQLRYVEVGNEDWLAGGAYGWETYKQYRFPMFMKAIRDKYPDITVISSGASSDANGFDIPDPAIGDYHPYREPDSLVEEFNRFDNDKGHIIGEIAATHPNGGTSWDGGLYVHPWWIGSVGEAVSLIGYERNSDRIPGTFYAPVLRNLNRWQWSVTILSFAADPALTTRSTSWYVWEMFAAHPITHTLPATAEFGPLYYVSGKNEKKGNFIWKGAAYNTTNHADVPVSLKFDGVKGGARAVLKVLSNKTKDPYAINDPYKPVNVVKSDTKIIKANNKGAFEFKLPELSVAVLDTDVGVNTQKRFNA